MGKDKSVEQEVSSKYKKYTHHEHILKRAGTYMGSTKPKTGLFEVYVEDDEENEKITKKNITYTPGFFKTIDELIVNARDHQVREKSCKTIKISYSLSEGWIKVYNDGPGIPVIIHKEHKIYIPEMIFGNLLTSSNYDDEEKRIVGGLNGYGAKLANIYSKKFIVETVDTAVGKKKFVQEFTNNMLNKTEPKITKLKSSDTSYTEITFYPDFEKFGMDQLTVDDIGWIQKRAHDIAACTRNNVKIYINDKRIKIRDFNDYISMYYQNTPPLIYREISDRWKVGVIFAQDAGNHHVSFVNAIDTFNGGTHVKHVLDQIVNKTIEHVKKKFKLQVKPALVKEHLDLFVDATIENPDFQSQTKGELTTEIKDFGSTCDIPQKMMDELFATGLVDIVVKTAQFKEQNQLNKTDGKKQSTINVPKLEDARLAGTRHSLDCRLILTEGDSAKAFAMSGLTVIGKDRYGVFPLRGKLLNVRNAKLDQIKKSQEIANIKTIIGLKQGTKYDNMAALKKLRYGGIVLLCDQDDDGIHIKGLIINMIQTFWPDLLLRDDFIQTLSTPLIKAFKKTDKQEKNPIIFYSEKDYNRWAEDQDIDKWNVSYYKGLGTSTEREQKQAFQNYDKRVVSYIWDAIDGDTKKKSKEREKDKDSNDGSSSDSDESDTSSTASNDESIKDSQTGGAKKRKTKKKNKLDITVTDPEIINSKSYDALTKAFDESRVDERKELLRNYNKDDVIDYTNTKVTYSEFIYKDLIHFSNSDIQRSIPSLVDGLKPSQRKILYVCLRDNIKTAIKVNQLASRVSEKTAYKHGESSLEGTIVGMAQDYPGSNNINCLLPKGNFGYRNEGGKNYAASRYIKTNLETIADKIFNKNDSCILNYLEEEGEMVEPEFYYPILPMVLVNGASGIGTGFATDIPQYNPVDICENLLRLLDDEQMEKMLPWYQGFTGIIEQESSKKYRVYGKYDVKDSNLLNITEIPIVGNYSSTNAYEEKVLKPLAGMTQMVTVSKDDKTKGKRVAKKEPPKKSSVPVVLSSFFKHPGNNVVNFEVQFIGNELQKLIKKGGTVFEDTFKLTSTISTTNMCLYNSKGVITYYNDALDIMSEFYDTRLEAYKKRKKYRLKVLTNELKILKYKAQFIKDYLSRTLKIERESKQSVIDQLKALGYPELTYSITASEDKQSYDYLLTMHISSLTKEKIEELENQRDSKQEEFDDYSSIGEKELWRREINDFMTAYDKWMQEKRDRMEDEDENGSVKKKKKSKK
jgi:DNA topoisomerase II